MIGFGETRRRLRLDRERLREHYRYQPWRAAGSLWIDPAYQAVVLFRWSHYLLVHGHRLLARLLWHINVFLTGADLSPISEVEGGLLLDPPLGVILVGKAGRNLTLRGRAGIGAGMGTKNIGAGPGLPSLGTNVVLDFGSFILGPVTIGDSVYVGPLCFVRSDVPAYAVLSSTEAKVRRRGANETALTSRSDV